MTETREPIKPGLYVSDDQIWVDVMSTSSPDRVTLTHQGGGFVLEMPLDEFRSRFKPAATPGFVRRTVSADWLPGNMKLLAYANGLRWNGWAMPFFPLEEARRLLDHMPRLQYLEESDTFVFQGAEEFEEADEVFVAKSLDINGKSIKVYAIGAGSWCWDFDD